MDLGLTEEQELLKNFARDFLTNECTEKLVRDMEEDDRGYTDDLWNGMANQGWMGLITAEELGGAGLSFLDLCVLLMLVAISTALVLGGQSGSMTTLLMATGLTGLGVRVVQLITLLRLAGVRAAIALRAYRDFVILSLPGLGLIGIALIWQQPWVTTIAMVCGGTLYAALVIWREKLYQF